MPTTTPDPYAPWLALARAYFEHRARCPVCAAPERVVCQDARRLRLEGRDCLQRIAAQRDRERTTARKEAAS